MQRKRRCIIHGISYSVLPLSWFFWNYKCTAGTLHTQMWIPNFRHEQWSVQQRWVLSTLQWHTYPSRLCFPPSLWLGVKHQLTYFPPLCASRYHCLLQGPEHPPVGLFIQWEGAGRPGEDEGLHWDDGGLWGGCVPQSQHGQTDHTLPWPQHWVQAAWVSGRDCQNLFVP